MKIMETSFKTIKLWGLKHNISYNYNNVRYMF